jgi:hypothetical protein
VGTGLEAVEQTLYFEKCYGFAGGHLQKRDPSSDIAMEKRKGCLMGYIDSFKLLNKVALVTGGKQRARPGYRSRIWQS